MTDHIDVLVVGAGVGGAAAALALARQASLSILLIDRRSGPGNINRGDSLLPAVTRHLRTWGALDAVLAAGARPVDRMQVFHHRAGLLFEAPLSAPPGPHEASDTDGAGAPYVVLAHPEIERALVKTAVQSGRVEVRYRCRLVGLIEERGRVVGARLLDETRGEIEVRASLVVGADGSSSVVRDTLGIELRAHPYRHGFYILDAERPAAYRDAMRIELHPDGGVLVVPQGAARIGLGVLVRERDRDLFRAGALADKVAAIARRSPLLADLQPVPAGAHLYSLSRGHAARYVARGCALLGDAVHLTNPTVGQGMTMAIEDAAALARHVGGALTAGPRGATVHAALDGALHAYQRERHPKNGQLVRLSDWASRFYGWDGALADGVRRAVFGLGATPLGRAVQQRIWSRMATRPSSSPPTLTPALRNP